MMNKVLDTDPILFQLLHAFEQEEACLYLDRFPILLAYLVAAVINLLNQISHVFALKRRRPSDHLV